MELDHSTYNEINEGIKIEVTPSYVPERSIPQKNIFFYSYNVKITNLRENPCQLISRYWIIKNGFGKEDRVSGDGVVGETPILRPGEFFNYTSFCPLPTPTGNMRGSYGFKEVDSDLSFEANIPLFFLRSPETFH